MNKTENSNQPVTGALWDYALGLYRDKNVEAACLRLQDEAGLDVIMLFYCLWAARGRGALGRDAIERAMAALAPWTTGVIAPLRAVRRRLKAASGAEVADQAAPNQTALRRAVADCELAAERMACFMLAARLPPLAGSPARRAALGRADAAAANLADYLAAARVSLSPPLAADLARLVDAAAPEAPPVQV